jgi:hypothetical protein
MKNFKDPIGNRTHDLPACTAVPRPTVLPRTPYCYVESEYSRLLGTAIRFVTPCFFVLTTKHYIKMQFRLSEVCTYHLP